MHIAYEANFKPWCPSDDVRACTCAPHTARTRPIRNSAVTGCSLTVPTLAPQDSPGLATDEELEHQDAMALDAVRCSLVDKSLLAARGTAALPLGAALVQVDRARTYHAFLCLCRPKRQVPDSTCRRCEAGRPPAADAQAEQHRRQGFFFMHVKSSVPRPQGPLLFSLTHPLRWREERKREREGVSE